LKLKYIDKPLFRFHTCFHVNLRPCIAAAPGDGAKGLGLLEWLGPVIPQGVLVTGVKSSWRLAWQVRPGIDR
jgi:hypothetical protein